MSEEAGTAREERHLKWVVRWGWEEEGSNLMWLRSREGAVGTSGIGRWWWFLGAETEEKEQDEDDGKAKREIRRGERSRVVAPSIFMASHCL